MTEFRLAAPQVFLSREVGEAEVRGARRAGLTRVRRGAYAAVAPDLQDWARREVLARARCHAVARQISADVTFSHQSAALLHGLWLWKVDNRTHVVQRYGPSKHGDPTLVRHRGELADSDRVVVDVLPVTSIERTVLDCARTMHPRDALVVVDSAMRILCEVHRTDRERSLQRMATVRAALLERLESVPRWRGIVQARAVIRAADGLSESAGESALRWIALSRGLPAPELQLPVSTPRGLFYTDGGWRWAAGVLAFEYDGAIKYRGGSGKDAALVVEREKAREDAIRETGVRVLRFVARDLVQEEATFARLCAALPPEVVEPAAPVAGLYRVPRTVA